MGRRHGKHLARWKQLAVVVFLMLSEAVTAPAQGIPAELSDEQFWKVSSEASEPDGTFRSDNLLSNELYFQYVLAELEKTARPGRVYMGVGPEQNFTYIAALRPKMAFIVDIRRGNLDLHLMYKALFELSENRVEFASRLFSRKRPATLLASSTSEEIFAALAEVEPSEEFYNATLKAIKENLTEKHKFPLSEGDLSGIDYVFGSFFRFGPNINYNSSTGNGRGFGGIGRATYATLMTATDQNGTAQSYLANEDNFQFLKTLESRNLLVPVVGNFAGPKAIRAVRQYLKGINGTVSAFYLSNVEDYLGGIWNIFCANVATLPLDETSTFIRSARGGRFGAGAGLNSDLGNMMSETRACGPGGN